MSYGSRDDPQSGGHTFTGRVCIGLGTNGYQQLATVRTADGAVTALDAAIRAALQHAPFHFGTLPEVRLLDYTIALADPTIGIRSPAIARARVSLDGAVTEETAVHPDGVIAACCVLCAVYDAYLVERWGALLGMAGLTVEDALRGYASAD